MKLDTSKIPLYYKCKNNYGTPGPEWWIYYKIIGHNGDGETCRVFMFQRTSREHHFEAGMDSDFMGNIDTNKYHYYCDLYEPCTKEEFERELQIFLDDFIRWMQFIRCSP